MKAKIRFRKDDGKYSVKTIEVDKNEPCSIVREFIKVTRLPIWTYITTVKCGRYEYQWFGTSKSAY